MRLDDGIAFGVQGHCTDRSPVARGARPALRIACTSLEIYLVAGGEAAVDLVQVDLRAPRVSVAPGPAFGPDGRRYGADEASACAVGPRLER